MIRHIHWYAVAPGREAEGERAMSEWVTRIRTADGCREASLGREDDHMRGVLAVVQDWDSDASLDAFMAVNKAANPTAPDTPGHVPADQGNVLFADGAHDHEHGHAAHEHGSRLTYNRGGGLFARLIHGHFQVTA